MDALIRHSSSAYLPGRSRTVQPSFRNSRPSTEVIESGRAAFYLPAVRGQGRKWVPNGWLAESGTINVRVSYGLGIEIDNVVPAHETERKVHIILTSD